MDVDARLSSTSTPTEELANVDISQTKHLPNVFAIANEDESVIERPRKKAKQVVHSDDEVK